MLPFLRKHVVPTMTKPVHPTKGGTEGGGGDASAPAGGCGAGDTGGGGGSGSALREPAAFLRRA